MGETPASTSKPVWTRGRVLTRQCPKSLISGESYRYLELHRTWRSLGRGCLLDLDAKTADALELLEEEMAGEEKYEEEE